MEESEGLQLHLQLHKLSCIESEQTLDHILNTLWTTRKTGLRPPEKSRFQSLLHLASLSELDPVLVCLRWLIRKFVYQNLTGDELVKLFPPDLPLHLQTILLLCFQKNGQCWRDDVSAQQDLLPVTGVSSEVRTDVPSLPSLPSPAMSTPLWPRQDPDSLAQTNQSDFGISTPLVADCNVSGLPACFQCDVAPFENSFLLEHQFQTAQSNLFSKRSDLSFSEENLPFLKSMTWTMENCGSSPADRVAIITLKLHDRSKSSLGETEVKFQLTRDTLEALLASMTYISEQLSAVGTSSGPANKKQKQ